MDEILRENPNGGYNENYGLLGSNKATEDKINQILALTEWSVKVVEVTAEFPQYIILLLTEITGESYEYVMNLIQDNINKAIEWINNKLQKSSSNNLDLYLI